MSDVSVLSKKFNELVSLSNKFNEAVIALKKKYLAGKKQKKSNNKGKASQTVDLDERRKYLVYFLQNLLDIIEKTGSSSQGDLSSSLFDNFIKRIHSYPFIKDELKFLISKIENNKELDEENFQILDKLLSELDNERNVLFKKLRSSRG